MCGRFVLQSDTDVLKDHFGLQKSTCAYTNYNKAPSNDSLVVFNSQHDQQKILGRMEWGLLPSWAKDENGFRRSINARSETMSELPSFKRLVKSRRCLIPASGFYEWTATSTIKQPHYIYSAEHSVFAFAGLYDIWKKDNTKIYSFAIITCAANADMAALHHRMPVILTKDHHDAWLLQATLPDQNIALHHHPVSTDVNKPTNNNESLILRVG